MKTPEERHQWYCQRIILVIMTSHKYLQAVLGEFSALNHQQPAAIRNSPPRTKRVFVLAETNRSQTKSFIPLSTDKATCVSKIINSPTKARANNKCQTSADVCHIGSRAKDDATFLALLHIEPLVDRDLFRSLFLSTFFFPLFFDFGIVGHRYGD
jgi:hypothetical protein